MQSLFSVQFRVFLGRSFPGLDERGRAFPCETIRFTAGFKCRPWIVCNGGLQVKINDASATRVKFSGTGEGSYEIVGE